MIQNGPLYKSSKLQKVVFLLSPVELRSLFDHLEKLGDLCFFRIGALLDSKNADTKIDSFISAYESFYKDLENGDSSSIKAASTHLSRSLSIDKNICIYDEAPGGKLIAKLTEPGVYVRICKVALSLELKKLHVGALGNEAFIFGLEVSYPQLVQKVGHEVQNALTPPFKNGILFKQLRRFVRAQTMPAKFYINDEVLFSELRVAPSTNWILDKMCLKWPGLKPKKD